MTSGSSQTTMVSQIASASSRCDSMRWRINGPFRTIDCACMNPIATERPGPGLVSTPDIISNRAMTDDEYRTRDAFALFLFVIVYLIMLLFLIQLVFLKTDLINFGEIKHAILIIQPT